MDVGKYAQAIKDTSWDKKAITSTLVQLNRREKEELLKWFKEDNIKLDYDIESYRKKIEEIRNRLYEYRKSN